LIDTTFNYLSEVLTSSGAREEASADRAIAHDTNPPEISSIRGPISFEVISCTKEVKERRRKER
jgi:hypothetical protein